MVTMHEECTIEEKHSVVLFLWAKGLNAKDIRKEMFMVGSVRHVKQFTIGLGNYHFGDKSFANDEEIEMEVQKRLRQHSKDIYAVGFNAQVKQRDKCISVGGGYVEK
jgi:hypothetical protein